MPIEVRLSTYFSDLYDQLPNRDLDLIDAFWEHCESYGLNGWEGKIKPSWLVPYEYADRSVRIKHAKLNNLWHAHIGFPTWKPSRNPDQSYKVSDWVVHFVNRESDGYIRLVDYGFHNPFHLPSSRELA
ncbi:hypothetical protein PFL603g_03499 [Pseudomonas fluorescens]|uniref:Uncharacterized protein n=1 Tax=Pseudomonas fluorescens TaxID=294 RepID=A0A120FYP9_PSEFL|nr:hypothetical protein PFL603g_03499 [Pseudomonas fluorescens]